MPPLDWHGERVSVGTNLVDDVCAGTLATLDREVVEIEEQLGIESDRLISFWFVDYGYVDEHCGAEALACSSDGSVISGPHGLDISRHELVHALLTPSTGSRKPLFEEGIATAIGGGDNMNDGCLDDPDCANTQLDVFLGHTTSTQLGTAGYRAGADLLHGMLNQHGPAAVLAFIDKIDREMTPTRVREEYSLAFGRDLEQDFEAYKRGRYDQFSLGQLGCDHPLAPVDEQGIHLQGTATCDSEQVANEFPGEPNDIVVRWRVVIEPEQAGAFVASGTVSESLKFLYALRCEPESLSLGKDRWELGPWRLGLPTKPEPDQPILLDAGNYAVVWVDTLDMGGELDLLIAPPCTFEAQDCPSGQQCTIWNECHPQVATPALVGEACQQLEDEPLACAAGARCVNGTCIAECDATQTCPVGQVCGSTRLCGITCEILQPDCPAGHSCLPTNDINLANEGIGQCLPAGMGNLLDACDLRGNSCGLDLVCAGLPHNTLPIDAPCRFASGVGCCVPQCDPQAAVSECPASLPECDPVLDGLSGTCQAPA